MPQAPAWTLHSVMPSGPSIASTISISEMSAGVARQAVAAVDAAESLDQPGLRQRLQHLGDGRRFQAGALGEPGRAEHGVGIAGEHGQDDGGVIGEFGDPEHGVGSKRTAWRPHLAGPRRRQDSISTEIVRFHGGRLNRGPR